MKRINEAIQFAYKAHFGQERKSTGVPFITHPFAVGMMLAREGYDEDVIIAGILHDVWEDTEVELTEIGELFGAEVCMLVWSASEPDKSLSWEERKAHTISFTKDLSLRAKAVICADKIHNVESILTDKELLGEEVWNDFKRGKEEQAWYYTSMYESLCHGVSEEDMPRIFAEYKNSLDKLFAI